jgi:hypothetical protein
MRYFLTTLLLVFSQFAFAQSEGVLNKLLAPGPLMTGHAKLEGKDCLKCHTAGKGISDDKCMECHKEIRPFVEKKVGFHGLHTQSCRECHADHKGRDYFTTGVDQEKFKHEEQTGFSLTGKHADLKCEECHTEKRTKKMVHKTEIQYFGATTTCVSCHKKDDIHFFKGKWAKKDCSACHGPDSWKEKITFDHSKDTKFKLVERHAELKCSECHIPNKKNKKLSKYNWPNLKKDQCIACHENVHIGKMGSRFQNGKCTTCHSQRKWTIPQFDHSVTRYKLGGKHAELKCQECHTQKPQVLSQESKKNWIFKGLKSQCLSCHKDVHRFGKHEIKKFAPVNNCVKCHTDSSWKKIINFDHNTSTRFAVDGKHLELKCQECHLTRDAKRKPPVWINPGIYRWPQLTQKTCENCHKNVHIGVFSAKLLKKACTECHVTDDWYTMRNGKKFDHSKTRFPLTGAHKTTSCSDCHGPSGKQVFKFKSASTGFCFDCHKTVHQGMFSSKYSSTTCQTCHTTENFTKRLDFDHNKTRMVLRDAHAKLDCIKCHVPSDKKILVTSPNLSKKQFAQGKVIVHGKYVFDDLSSKKCTSCHADIHRAQLGSDCMKCHTEKTWKIQSFDHTRKTEFPLRDKHREVKCEECHKPFKNVWTQEMGKKIATINYKKVGTNCIDCHKDVHKGEFGARCQDCHSERGWKVTRDFHRNFTLSGVHYSLECGECHKDGKKLAGLSQQCITCHQKDDIHFGTLPNCQECHRQQFWESSRFRHSMTQFPLRGAHRTLDCAQCHTLGVYQGLNPNCVSCHLNDTTNLVGHPAVSAATNCTECHRNQFSFGQVVQ